MKKRKDAEIFDDEFPSISPSNSSRKSRRLDPDLCPIMEEDPNVSDAHVLEPGFSQEQPWSSGAMVHEETASVGANTMPLPTTDTLEERALVLYDPAITPFVKSPSSPEFSIAVKADLIPGLKDYLLSWGTKISDNSMEDEVRGEKSSEVSNDCLAVVPWVAAFHYPMTCEEMVPETGQPLEAEGEMMEMDEPYVGSSNEKAMEIGEKVEAAGASSPWQQQHCMMPNLLQSSTTPIHWC